MLSLQKGEQDSYSLFLRHRRASGASAWTQVNASLVRNSEGHPVRIVRSVSDVSTRHLEEVIAFGEQQRQLLALDLHDSLAQHLVLAGQKTHLKDPESALKAVREDLRLAELDVRRLHRDLTSPQTARRSYRKALKDYILNFESDFAITVHWSLKKSKLGWPVGLPALFLYRIIQEALSNVRRHAQADQVWIRVRIDSFQIRGEISDNGVGLTPSAAEGRQRLGLAGIRLRCRLLGGRSRIITSAAERTRLQFVLPISSSSKEER